MLVDEVNRIVKFITYVRMIIALIILISGILTFITGVLLYTAPAGRGGQIELLGLAKNDWRTLHSYFAFTLAGFSITHIYLNFNAIARYFKELFSIK